MKYCPTNHKPLTIKFFLAYIISIILAIAGCTNEQKPSSTYSFEGFTTQHHLKGEKSKLSNYVYKIDNMTVIDTFLIITQQRKDSIISIYSIPNLRLIKSFGKLGRGPEELYSNFLLQTFGPIHGADPSFAIANGMTNIWYYKIADVFENNLQAYLKISLPSTTNGFQTIGYFSDTLIIGAPYSMDMHLFKHNWKSNEFTKYRDYPYDLKFMEDESKTSIFGGQITVKPDNSLFALAYGNLSRIDIYDPNAGLVRSIEYINSPGFEESTGLTANSKEEVFFPEMWIFCWGLRCTNNYIYAKVYNREYNSIIKDGRGYIKTAIPEIHVFDWSGNPVAEICLDHFYNYFSVDQEDKFLYAIDKDIESEVLRYDLSSITRLK